MLNGALGVEVKYLYAVIIFFWSSCANADARNFLCVMPDSNSDVFTVMLSIDVNKKTMQIGTSWAEKFTVVFDERYIMNVEFNKTGRIGGMFYLFDRYTGELAFGGSNLEDFAANKMALGQTVSVWQCTEKKI